MISMLLFKFTSLIHLVSSVPNRLCSICITIKLSLKTCPILDAVYCQNVIDDFQSPGRITQTFSTSECQLQRVFSSRYLVPIMDAPATDICRVRETRIQDWRRVIQLAARNISSRHFMLISGDEAVRTKGRRSAGIVPTYKVQAAFQTGSWLTVAQAS